MNDWASGYTQSELDEAEERYGIRFPPDLAALLLDRSPTRGYNWNTDDLRIHEMLAWPTDMLLFDVDNGLWWPGWGERPIQQDARHEIVRDAITRAPRLIPVLGHRFIPETPSENGNPIFSMHGFDTIYYGANLTEYFANEFGGLHKVAKTRRIDFWSDIVEGHGQMFTGAPYAR
jgi:hypothetical protein